MTSPTANTVVISQVAGTSLWIWTRYCGMTRGLTDANGASTGQTEDIICPISSTITFPDSDSAKANARAISADLDSSAFTVAE